VSAELTARGRSGVEVDSDGSVEVRLTPAEMRSQLRRDVAQGLSRTPKSIPPAWFYDEHGSNLFDEITRLDEYYQSRTERALLSRHATDIVSGTGVCSLVELGSGTCEKTRIVLDELAVRGRLECIVPIDISAEMLARSVAELSREYPMATVRGVVTDFDGALAELPAAPARLVALLGGTIGNFHPADRARFFADLSGQLLEGDWFLLGCDLVKDHRRLVAAYDDARGVTAAFNRNVLSVVNRELGADFDLGAFAHVARWDDEQAWIEMRLRSLTSQTVTVRDLDLEVTFAEGEEMQTEISAKFTVDRIRHELMAGGFTAEAVWTDSHDDYALVLAKPCLGSDQRPG